MKPADCNTLVEREIETKIADTLRTSYRGLVQTAEVEEAVVRCCSLCRFAYLCVCVLAHVCMCMCSCVTHIQHVISYMCCMTAYTHTQHVLGDLGDTG